jgi:transmembrane sensor
MQEKRQDPLVEEALHWLVVLKDRNASEADRQAFDEWLKQDSSHEAAWQRAQQVWMRLDRIGPAFRNRAPLPAHSPRLATPPSMSPRLSEPVVARPGMGRRRVLYAAAGIAAVAAPASVMLARPGLFADHASGVGERRTVSLGDGSTVELAGSSSLSIDFAADLRRIVLHEGEAFFNVVQDPARPFVVDAATGRTRASVAAFDVKISPPLVTVAVTAHSVSVSANGAEQVAVNEGQRVRYGPNLTGPVREANLDQVEAWRRDRLVFQNTMLGDVIADLERYRGGRIIMIDSALRRLPVTAAFDTSEADAALDAIASALEIRVYRVSGLLVVLSLRS